MDSDTGSAVDPSEPDVRAAPRPDLNGRRVVEPGQHTIYLIDEGVRREIPDHDTYYNLFGDNWSGILSDLGVGQISVGKKIESGTVLVRGYNTDRDYLVDSTVKRWIANSKTWERYSFAKTRVCIVPQFFVLAISDGKTIEYA